jgi:pimeloyl-ACP methyl ester carboxylesterase
MKCNSSKYSFCKYSSFIFLLFVILLALNSCSEENATEPELLESKYKDKVYENYTVIENNIYSSNYDQNDQLVYLKFDYYTPQNASDEERPLVIIIPGGAFIYLSYSSVEELAKELTYYGYNCAVVNYRLLASIFDINEENYYDISIKARADLKAAIRYFYNDKANENHFNIDTNNIFLCGHSAGAITALNTVFIDENDDLPEYLMESIEDNGGFSGNSGFESYSDNIKGVINLSGAMYDLSFIDNNDIDLLNIHGTFDTIVPYDEGDISGFGLSVYVYGSKSIHEYMLSKNNKSNLFLYQNGSHTTPVEDIEITTSEIIDFIFPLLEKRNEL